MAVIILVRRGARADKLNEFNENYRAERPTHEGFVAQFLTRVATSEKLPRGLCTLPLAAPGVPNISDVAIWGSAEAFDEHFNPTALHNRKSKWKTAYAWCSM